jgi:hypothetical protein
MENWKPLNYAGYESQYEISDLGNVRNAKTKRVRKTKRDLQGYVSVILCQGDTQKNKRVHRLVALTFLPNPENLPEVNHIDHDKENCAAINLEWCNREHNETAKVRHRKANGTYRNGRAKMDHAQVRRAHELRGEGKLQREIAKELGVSRSAVGYALQGKTHAEVANGSC